MRPNLLRSALLLAGLALATPATAAPAPPACTPLAGLEALIRPDIRYILFGEYHGTVEMPAIVADALCSGVATGRDVILGIEMHEANQPGLDAYLASDGSRHARAELLKLPAWSEEGGRSTVAILDLVYAAWRLAHAGHKVTIVAFDSVPVASGTSTAREAGMAASLHAAAARSPNSLVIALTGVGHAGRAPWTSYTPPFDGLGGLLPKEQSLIFAFARPGGNYWGCHAPDGTRDGCKPYAMPVREPVSPRGVRIDASARDGFDGVYSAGGPYTASAPARQAKAP